MNESPPPLVELITAKDGYPFFKVSSKEGGTSQALASSYSPFKEASRISEDLSDNPAQIVFILGAGNPSLIRLALEKLEKRNTPIVVAEDNLQIRDLFMEWLQTTHDSLFSKSKTQLLWADQIDEEQLKGWLKKHSVKKIKFLNNQRQIRLYSDFFLNFKDRVIKIHSERSTNRSTFARFEKLWLRNITKNTTQIIKSYPLYGCWSLGKNLPAVIVGAGPSLAGNLKDLKDNQERLVIIACDTALKVLLHHGIHPDFVVAVDPQKVNSRYLENIPEDLLSKTILICEPGVGDQAIRQFPNTLMFDSIFPYYRFLSNIFHPKGEIDIGGTVISAAYEITKVFDFSPIAFMGMDFCFREGAYHLPGTMYEEIFFSLLHRFQTFEMFFSTVINNESTPTLNHLNEPVFIDGKFTLFKNWLSKKIIKDNILAYNSSWGGMAVQGLPHLPFIEFLDQVSSLKYPKGDVTENKRQMLQRLSIEITRFRNDRTLGSPEFEKNFAVFQNEFKTLINGIEDYQTILKRALHDIQKKNTDKILFSQIEIIDSPSARIAKPFVEIVVQKTLNQITGSSKQEEVKDAFKPLQHLYQELYDACSLNLKYLERVRFEGRRVYSRQ